MEKPDPLRGLVPFGEALDERIGVKTDGMRADDFSQACVKKNEVNFRRQESGDTQNNEHDSKPI